MKKLYTGITKDSWEKIWKEKKLINKLTNMTDDLDFALDYSYNFSTGKYEDIAIEISKIPIDAFISFRDIDYEDDEDFENLDTFSEDEKIKKINENSLFLIDLFKYKDVIEVKLIDKNNLCQKVNKIKRNKLR